jgi:hypothetical protein
MTLTRESADMPLPSGDAMLSEILDHYGQSALETFGEGRIPW